MLLLCCPSPPTPGPPRCRLVAPAVAPRSVDSVTLSSSLSALEQLRTAQRSACGWAITDAQPPSSPSRAGPGGGDGGGEAARSWVCLARAEAHKAVLMEVLCHLLPRPRLLLRSSRLPLKPVARGWFQTPKHLVRPGSPWFCYSWIWLHGCLDFTINLSNVCWVLFCLFSLWKGLSSFVITEDDLFRRSAILFVFFPYWVWDRYIVLSKFKDCD